MARGQVFTLPNQTANLIETFNKDEASAVAVLNPNDGVVYLKLNGPAGPTPSQWDWKLPSQSYGLFPGPWVSLGLYYLDQSGSGRSAELNVYDSQDKMYTPYIIAIGRAVQSAGTTVDISQGTIPQNPPASTARLWVDGTGHLHVLQSNGTDYTTLDSNNYNSMITMIGDVVGPLNNTTVQYRNNTTAYAYDSVGTRRNHLTFGSETLWWAGVGGGFRWVNQGNTAEWMRLDTSAGLTVQGSGVFGNNLNVAVQITAGTIVSNGSIHGTDIYASRGDGTGVVYFGNATPYLFYNGSTFVLNGSLNVNTAAIIGSTLTVNGNQLYLNGPGGVGLTTQIARSYSALMTNTGQGDLILGGGSSILYMHPNLSVYIAQAYPYFDIVGFTTIRGASFEPTSNKYFFESGHTVNIVWNGTYLNHSHSIQFNTTGNQIVWPNGSYISGTAGYVQGSQRALKHSVATLNDSDLLSIVCDPRLHVSSYYWEGETEPNTGFMADEIAQVVPKSVVRNESGEPSGYNPQELTAILWGAVRELNKRVKATQGF